MADRGRARRQGAAPLLRPLHRGRGEVGKLPKLVALIDRYGPAIEADFHARWGIDLLHFLKGTLPWGKFWRLLDRLGDGSAYIRAQQNDPEVARYIAEKEAADAEQAEKEGRPAPAPWRPAADDWTLLHEMTARNHDRLGMVATLLADLPTPVKTRTPFPPMFSRPETLLDRYRREETEKRDKAADDRLMDLGQRAKQRWREQHGAPPAEANGAPEVPVDQ